MEKSIKLWFIWKNSLKKNPNIFDISILYIKLVSLFNKNDETIFFSSSKMISQQNLTIYIENLINFFCWKDCVACYSSLKPLYNEPQYSEFHDLVNKTQLPFWGFTKHYHIWYSKSLDIVNKKGLTDLFAISRFECTKMAS